MTLLTNDELPFKNRQAYRKWIASEADYRADMERDPDRKQAWLEIVNKKGHTAGVSKAAKAFHALNDTPQAEALEQFIAPLERERLFFFLMRRQLLRLSMDP